MVSDEEFKIVRNAIALLLRGLVDGAGRELWQEMGEQYCAKMDEARRKAADAATADPVDLFSTGQIPGSG
jgi:hypothetical protein